MTDIYCPSCEAACPATAIACLSCGHQLAAPAGQTDARTLERIAAQLAAMAARVEKLATDGPDVSVNILVRYGFWLAAGWLCFTIALALAALVLFLVLLAVGAFVGAG